MENLYLLSIIFIVIALIGFLIYHEKFFDVQKFATQIYTSSIPTRYCQECGKLSSFQCNRCINCGFCVTEKGFGECVPGDSTGPYFRQDCSSWNYYQPQLNTIFIQPLQSSWWYGDGSNWNVPRHVRKFDRSDRKRRPIRR